MIKKANLTRESGRRDFDIFTTSNTLLIHVANLQQVVGNSLNQLPFSFDKSMERLLQVVLKNTRQRHEKEIQEASVSLAKGTSVDAAVMAVLPDLKIGTKNLFCFFSMDNIYSLTGFGKSLINNRHGVAT